MNLQEVGYKVCSHTAIWVHDWQHFVLSPIRSREAVGCDATFRRDFRLLRRRVWRWLLDAVPRSLTRVQMCLHSPWQEQLPAHDVCVCGAPTHCRCSDGQTRGPSIHVLMGGWFLPQRRFISCTGFTPAAIGTQPNCKYWNVEHSLLFALDTSYRRMC